MDKRTLSSPMQWLIEQCQRVNFGRITIGVSGGQPDIVRPYSISRMVKLTGGENGPRPEIKLSDFELRQEHVAMLTHLSRIDDGARVTIEVRHGLPFQIEIDQEYQAA